MSKRAEERALEALPPRYRKSKYGTTKIDSVLPVRKFYIRAYEQAEKDLGWHSVEESLPEIDEEVIVLVNEIDIHPVPLKIAFAHRPDPKGWDAKSTLTGKMKHYTPETHNGWNIPGVRYWMPCPKIPEE